MTFNPAITNPASIVLSKNTNLIDLCILIMIINLSILIYLRIKN